MAKTFSKKEYSFLFSICSALGLRQLAMLLVMPVIAIYSRGLKGSTPALIGLSVGIFGLTQAMLQIPYGKLSDKFGRRKPFVIFGLIQLIIGLILAGMSKNIYLLIVGRALQGSGGIQAVSYAWISDNINDNKRSEAMELAGIFLGSSSVIGFLLGSLFNSIFTVQTIFFICASLVILSTFFVFVFGHDEKQIKKQENDNSIYNVLKGNYSLKGFIFIAFLMNYTMISMFFIVPQMLEMSLGNDEMWKVFVPATIIGIISMRFMNKYSRKGYTYITCYIAFVLIFITNCLLLTNSVIFIGFGMCTFMSAYIFLSTILPTYVTKIVPVVDTGKATGIFNTVQFLGTFVGGSITGILWGIDKNLSIILLFIVCIVAFYIIYLMRYVLGDRKNIEKIKDEIDIT